MVNGAAVAIILENISLRATQFGTYMMKIHCIAGGYYVVCHDVHGPCLTVPSCLNLSFYWDIYGEDDGDTLARIIQHVT